MLPNTLEYFNATLLREWCFVGFYQYREQQPNFKKSFDIEAFNLQKVLIHLLEKGTAEEKECAVKLSTSFKVIIKICDWLRNGWGTH